MTKLIIIGTIHQSTQRYTALDLYKAIEQIRPEVIFEELPPEMHKNTMQKSIPFGEELEGQEGSAINWYHQEHTCTVIPVDLPNRSKIFAKKISSDGYGKAFSFLHNILTSSKPTKDERDKLKLYFATVERQREMANKGTIREINSNDMDKLITIKHTTAIGTCIPILEKYSADKNLAIYWKNYEEWFEKRENYMAAQIIKHLKKFTCAVFPVGADHRVGLYQKLVKYAQLY